MPGEPDSVSLFHHGSTQGRCNGAREGHGFRRPELSDEFLLGETGVGYHQFPGVIAIKLSRGLIKRLAF